MTAGDRTTRTSNLTSFLIPGGGSLFTVGEWRWRIRAMGLNLSSLSTSEGASIKTWL